MSDQQRVAELQVENDRLRRERDAWRAATGLAHLTPREAGDKIDSDDAERDRLRKALEMARPYLDLLHVSGDEYSAISRIVDDALGGNQ